MEGVVDPRCDRVGKLVVREECEGALGDAV